jgi:cytochrome c oxidase subunit II
LDWDDGFEMSANTVVRNLLLGVALLATSGKQSRSAEGHSVASRSIHTPEQRVIRMTAERFTFTPSRIVVNAGDTIEFRLTSDDTAHGFRINGTDVNVVIRKRGMPETTVTLTAPAPGRYAFECTRMCGAGHNFMRGELIVRDQSKGANQR